MNLKKQRRFSNRTLPLITAVLWISTAVCSQDLHCLWEVPAGSGRIFLLGSMHALSESDYPLADAIEEAYEQSRNIYFELDLDSVAMPSVQQQIMMAGMLQGKTLKDVLSDSVYNRLAAVLSEYQMDIQMLQMFKPWMVSTLLTVAQLNALEINPESGIDRYFYKKAGDDHKATGSLESVDDQLRCFKALEGDLAEPMLLETMNSLDLLETEFGRMKLAWKTGNTQAIDSLMNSEIEDFPEIRKILLTDRNEKWLSRVERMIAQEENALVIVGAGHLVGKGSLVDLLRKKGFEVLQR